MDGAARLGVPGGDGARMGVESWIFRQQAGVDVDHPTLPPADQPRREQPHVARHCDNLHPPGPERRVNRRLMRGAVPPEQAMIDGHRPDVPGTGNGQTPGLGVVGEDQHHLIGRPGAPARVDQGGHVRAGSGNQNGHADGAFGDVHAQLAGAGSPTETKAPAGPGKTTGLS